MVFGRGDRPTLHGSSTSSARAGQGSAKTLTDENGEWLSATNFLALKLADEDSDCDTVIIIATLQEQAVALVVPPHPLVFCVKGRCF